MSQKLLLFDVDGTLVSYDGVIPHSMEIGLKKAREAGHLVFVVTGRTKNRATVGDIEVDGMICGNGAYIEALGKPIKDLSLSKEDVRKITDYLDDGNFDYFMEGNNGIYGSKNFEFGAVPAYKKYGLKNPVIRDLYPMIQFPEDMAVEGVIKINYILHTYQDYLTFKEKFSEYQCLTWGGKGEYALFGDCATKGIDKQVAIKELIAYLQIPTEDIYAFGDADVDIPMFEAVGTSICVGGGGANAKEVADYVTDDVKDDGIYNALVHFGLIKE